MIECQLLSLRWQLAAGLCVAQGAWWVQSRRPLDSDLLEEHAARAGMAASKKWKYTLRVDKPEAKSCTLGAYLDQLGVLEKSGRLECPPACFTYAECCYSLAYGAHLRWRGLNVLL
jgi:hypothetical protein